MRKTHPIAGLTAAAATLVATLGLAAAPTQDAPERIRKTIHERYPEVPIVDVKPSTLLPGLYEVFTGTAIVYADATGDHLIVGQVIDTRTKRDVTTDRLEARNPIDFSKLPLDVAIKDVRGNGQRIMAVFADPDCPFCKKLEQSLASVDNVTVYTFLYPIPELHPAAPEKARKIWCAADRAKTWTRWMRDGSLMVTGPDCNVDELDEIHTLGDQLKVAATPTIFFPSGRRVSRALSPEELNGFLDSEGAKKPAGMPN